MQLAIVKGLPEYAGFDVTSMGPALVDVNGNPITSANARTLIPLTASVPATGTVAKATAGNVAPDQTARNFGSSNGVSVATGATINLYVVAAGKAFYLTDIAVYSNTATPFTVQLKAGAVVIWEGYCKGDTGPIQVSGIETQPVGPSGTQISLVLGTAAATTASYNIAGFEQ